VYAKLELLDKEFKTVETIEGEVVEDNYSIDAESDIRRTYNVTLIVKDSALLIGSDRKIWLDKYIRVSTGIIHSRTREIRWYPLGIYIFSAADYSYDASTKTLTLSCLDRMAELTGTRNGQVSGIAVSIPMKVTNSGGAEVYNTIRSAMVDTVTQLGKISKYRIEDVGGISNSGEVLADEKSIPHDLEFGAGTYVFDIIRQLRDLYPGWETYFDDDRFICQPIPTAVSDPIVLDSGTLASLVVSENTNVDFGAVKNVTEIWGASLQTEYYTSNVNITADGPYRLMYTQSISSLVTGTRFGFKAPADSQSGAQIKVNSLAAYPILAEGNTPIAAGRIKAGKSYVVRYSGGYFYFMGEYQICAVSKLMSREPSSNQVQYDLANEPTTNISYVVEPDTPFGCDIIGEIRQVLAGSDYDATYSEGLAVQRAEYENWKNRICWTPFSSRWCRRHGWTSTRK
jgi:hypothetical protein